MAFHRPLYWHPFGPYGLNREEIIRHDAWRELRALTNQANALFCSLYKVPPHKLGPKIDLLESSEVVIDDKHKFQIFLHAEGFKPDELKIAEAGGKLSVSGSHDEREDERGFIERSFVRTYILPKELDANEISASLTPEGILAIEATKHDKLPERPAARAIPIEHAYAGYCTSTK